MSREFLTDIAHIWERLGTSILMPRKNVYPRYLDVVDCFLIQCGWNPQHFSPLHGALSSVAVIMWSKYGFLGNREGCFLVLPHVSISFLVICYPVQIISSFFWVRGFEGTQPSLNSRRQIINTTFLFGDPLKIDVFFSHLKLGYDDPGLLQKAMCKAFNANTCTVCLVVLFNPRRANNIFLVTNQYIYCG